MDRTPGRRETRKRATRAALVTVAHRRFHAHGFEKTTIEEICEEVGVSRRTFFRYFRSKEDLVFPNREERLERFLEVLAEGPEGEGAFDTLRRATGQFGPEYMAHRTQLIAQQTLISKSPALRAREAEIDRDWEAAMVGALLARGPGGPAAELRARVIAGACIGIIRATMRHWFAGGGVDDLTALGTAALDSLERGFPLA